MLAPGSKPTCSLSHLDGGPQSLPDSPVHVSSFVSDGTPSLLHSLPTAPPTSGICSNCSFCLEHSPQIVLKFTPSLMSVSTDAISSEITFSVLDENLHIYCLSFSLECKERKVILFVMFTSVSPLCITTQAYSGHLIKYSLNEEMKNIARIQMEIL